KLLFRSIGSLPFCAGRMVNSDAGPPSKVYPSGGALATACPAISPPAPGLASIRTCCPHLTESCSPIARVAMSSALPGGTGSTILMGLFGYLSCASAAAAVIEAAAIRAAHKKRGTLSSIGYARAKRLSADDPHQWVGKSRHQLRRLPAGPLAGSLDTATVLRMDKWATSLWHR